MDDAFLTGVRPGAPAVSLKSDRGGPALATAVELALTRRARRHGLLGRDHLAPGVALVLAPCCSIHTAFMRFAIDVVFIDRAGRVLKIVRNLRPWRIATSPLAHAVIELPGGSLPQGAVSIGDRLRLGVASSEPSHAP